MIQEESIYKLVVKTATNAPTLLNVRNVILDTFSVILREGNYAFHAEIVNVKNASKLLSKRQELSR